MALEAKSLKSLEAKSLEAKSLEAQQALAPAVSDPAASAAIGDEDEKLKEQEMITSKYGGRMMTLTKLSSRMCGMLMCIPIICIIVAIVVSNPSELNHTDFKVFFMMGVGLVVAMKMLDCFAKGAWPKYEQHFPNNKVYPPESECPRHWIFNFMEIEPEVRKDLIALEKRGLPPTWEQVKKFEVDKETMKHHDYIENNTFLMFGLLLFLMSFHCALLAMTCFAIRAGHKVHQVQTKEVEIEMALVGSAVSTP